MAVKIPNKKLRIDLSDDYINYRFRDARVEAGYTAKELAEEVGVSMDLIYSYERLRCSPGKVVAQRISGLLGKDVSELFSERLHEIAREVKEERRGGDSQDALDYLDLLNGSVEGQVFFMENSLNPDQMRERIFKVLSTLSYREREIIKLRYGFADGFIHTYGEIASQFEVTGEMIRQIEKKAIEKLQEPEISERLEGLLGL